MSDSRIKLSVLMAVFAGDKPEWLVECFDSLRIQTRPADQIVVVLDGPIPGELRAVLDRYRSTLPLSLIEMERNVGLGIGLRTGLEHCAHNYVARMDADDVCVKNRFEKQLDFLAQHPEIDVLGSWIGEFDSKQPDKIYAVRQVPETHDEIKKAARLRNPFNHMTVVFKKDVIQRAGSYRSFRLLEDYDLWVRLLLSGARGWNLPEVLVWARAGTGFMVRRGGWSYLSTEYVLLFSFYRSGFIRLSDLLLGLTMRTLVRLAPRKLRELSYRGIRMHGSYK